MLKVFKRFEQTIYFLIKTAAVISLFLTLIWLRVKLYPPSPIYIEDYFRLSRIMVIISFVFFLSEIVFIRIYGGFAIGKYNSTEIFNRILLATLVSDTLSFVAISVMEKSIPNLISFVFAFVIQTVLIYLYCWLANYIYFKLNPPNNSLIVYSDEDKANVYMQKVGKYKKQWNICDVKRYDDLNIKESILKNQEVFIVDIPTAKREEIIEYCYKHNKNLHIFPAISDVIVHASKQHYIDNIMVLSSDTQTLSFEQQFIKRLIDIVASVLGLIITCPVMIIAAMAIKFSDNGKVMFKQERMTKNGRRFMILKFRTMKENSENISISKNDDRITPVGKVLRKLRIDELPQFINILKGDMSLVGPRPEMIENIDKYTKEFPEFAFRLKVKAGLTGYAQIMGKYNTAPKDKLMMDLVYIENCTIWLDIKLILQTLAVLLKKDSTEGFESLYDLGVDDKNK